MPRYNNNLLDDICKDINEVKRETELLKVWKGEHQLELGEYERALKETRETIMSIAAKMDVLATKFDRSTEDVARNGDKLNKLEETRHDDMERRDMLRESLRAEMKSEFSARDDKLWELRNALTLKDEQLLAGVATCKKRLDSTEQSICNLTLADKELYRLTWKQIGLITGASAAIGGLVAFLTLMLRFL